MTRTIRLYHYTKAEYLEQLFATRRLKLTDITRTNDPAEYSPTIIGENQSIYHLVMNIIEKCKNAKPFLILSCSRLMSSLSMWGNYADSHKGVCLVFDIPIIEEYYKGDFYVAKLENGVRLIRVTYSSSRLGLKCSDYGLEKNEKGWFSEGEPAWDKLYLPLGRKGKDWSHECEYRLDFSPVAGTAEIFVDKGLYFSRTILQYCTGILLGLKCPMSELYVQSLIRQYKYDSDSVVPELKINNVEKTELDKLFFRINTLTFEDSPPVTEDGSLVVDADTIQEYMTLAEVYRYGNARLAPNKEKSLQYYQIAAEMGDWDAMEQLADLLEELGRGDEAAQWRQRRGAEMQDA